MRNWSCVSSQSRSHNNVIALDFKGEDCGRKISRSRMINEAYISQKGTILRKNDFVIKAAFCNEEVSA